MLSTLLNQIILVYGPLMDRATCRVHLISSQGQPERKQIYHCIREAKSLLFKHIYTLPASHTNQLGWVSSQSVSVCFSPEITLSLLHTDYLTNQTLLLTIGEILIPHYPQNDYNYKWLSR